MLSEAFGEHSLTWAAIFERHSHFKTGHVLFEEDELSGQPNTSKIIKIVKEFENSSTKSISE
jgi:hypothetical protein